MHYALTVLDKSNGTQSDAGPVNAGATLATVGSMLADVMGNLSEDVSAMDKATAMGQAVSAVARREWGAEAPWSRSTVSVCMGLAVRLDVHDDDTCDCEI